MTQNRQWLHKNQLDKQSRTICSCTGNCLLSYKRGFRGVGGVIFYYLGFYKELRDELGPGHISWRTLRDVKEKMQKVLGGCCKWFSTGRIGWGTKRSVYNRGLKSGESTWHEDKHAWACIFLFSLSLSSLLLVSQFPKTLRNSTAVARRRVDVSGCTQHTSTSPSTPACPLSLEAQGGKHTGNAPLITYASDLHQPI